VGHKKIGHISYQLVFDIAAQTSRAHPRAVLPVIPDYVPRHLRCHRAHRLCQVAHLVEIDTDGVGFAFAADQDASFFRMSLQHEFIADLDGVFYSPASSKTPARHCPAHLRHRSPSGVSASQPKTVVAIRFA
jgi:hypothetical protein